MVKSTRYFSPLLLNMGMTAAFLNAGCGIPEHVDHMDSNSARMADQLEGYRQHIESVDKTLTTMTNHMGTLTQNVGTATASISEFEKLAVDMRGFLKSGSPAPTEPAPTEPTQPGPSPSPSVSPSPGAPSDLSTLPPPPPPVPVAPPDVDFEPTPAIQTPEKKS